MPYFALGTGKTIMLNVTLANLGDDAFLPMVHLRLPTNLYFIKVLEAVRPSAIPAEFTCGSCAASSLI